MNPAIYASIFLMFIIIFTTLRNRKSVIARKIIEKRQKGDKSEMKELAKKFIDKECVILSFDSSHQFEGLVKEVSDGAILVEKNGRLEAINLDFVIKIKEHPRNKKGHKIAIYTVE